MFTRSMLCELMTVAIVLTSLRASQAQSQAKPDRDEDRRPHPVRVSSHEDDPFVHESIIRRMDPSRFSLGQDGRPILSGSMVTLSEESKVYRKDPQTGEYKPFAWNPWPQEPLSNAAGDFTFQDEERFPLHTVERDPDGKIILRDGLQLWTPNDRRLGSTTTFEAAHAVKNAAEFWAGRHILWGQNGLLDIEPPAFIDFNGFYSGNTRTLHFGVVPHRLPGQTDIKMFETATSWEMVAHESGHAVHDTLKPNRDWTDPRYGAWAESFSDQTAMWASLRHRNRVSRLLAETKGDLNQSNAITRLGEAFAALTGRGAALRDAFNDLKVSDTSEEVHDRSQVFTGAAYQIFLTVYDRLRSQQEMEEQEALRKAGEIMGVFLTRSNDYMPENRVSLEDVAKAYFKVDKEFFQGRYHNLLVNEFLRREILQSGSERDWLSHEATLPHLNIRRSWPDANIEAYILARLSDLGIGPEFGLKLQRITRTNGSASPALEQTIVRVQLTEGRGEGSIPLENHGIVVFRADGTLADYHAPLPGDSHQTAADYFTQVQAASEIGKARRLPISQFGVPLSLVRGPNGRISIEARVIRGEGLNAYVEVFTPGNPRGKRHDIMISPLPPNNHIRVSEDLLQ